jgi:hypothetical protein
LAGVGKKEEEGKKKEEGKKEAGQSLSGMAEPVEKEMGNLQEAGLIPGVEIVPLEVNL